MTDQPKRPAGMSVREAGQKGGETVKKKYGPEFYEQIGRKGGLATKQAHGHEFYEQIGKKGGKKGGEGGQGQQRGCISHTFSIVGLSLRQNRRL